MFTKEENLFLEAIIKMFSNQNEERKTSEKNIQTWLQETYLQVLISCNKFIVCEELQPNIRQYACYLIGLCTGEDHYADWQQISSEIKTSVQNNSLGLLGDQNPQIRQQACILVSSIFEISVRDQGWPELIKILCNACQNDNIEFKKSAVKTLGMIWEKLPKEPFSIEELNLMETTIISLLAKPQNAELAKICLKAYQYFIMYIKDKFSDKNYLEESLKVMITYCNSMNDINTENVIKSAIHRISQIILLAYDYVENNFRNISEFFIQLAQGKNETLAVQAFIFFTEISNDEITRKTNGISYRNYMSSIWDILWPCIQYILNMGENPNKNSDDFTRYEALNQLLVNLSILCNESIIDDIFKYMRQKLSEDDPIKIASAIYAFSSLIETVHEKKIRSVIPDSITAMTKYFSKNNDILNNQISFCFRKICEVHANLILENNALFTFLISSISQLLKENSLTNTVKMHLCLTINQLALYICNHNLQCLNFFSPFLQDLLITLEALAYLPSAYDPDNNLSEKSFIALASLLECSHEKDKLLISYFMEKINIRLVEAQDANKFIGAKIKLEFYQSMLCLLIQSLCKNSVNNLIQLDDKKIEEYFNIIENYFKMREGVFEEGMMALSGLISLLSENQIDKLLQRIMVYIIFALNNFLDSSNCSAACLSLLDIIHVSKEKFVPYIKEIFPLFKKIINSEDSKKNIFSLIIVVYSDLFNYIGESIWEYYKDPLDFMENIIDFSEKNNELYFNINNNRLDSEEINDFVKLNDGLVDFIQSVAGHLKKSDENKTEAFKSYMPIILEYIEVMMKNTMFNPSNDYLFSCISFLIDFAEIYKKYLFKKVSDYTWQRIFQLANNSSDDNVIHLKDYLQNLIYVIKMQS